jgi:hypothetical protein
LTLRLLAANTLTPNAGIAEAQVWYQVQQPELLDTSQALGLSGEKLTCDGKDVPLVGTPVTVAVSTAYPATATATIGGTFIRADIQWPGNKPTTCSLNGRVSLTTKGGNPAEISLPPTA